MKEYIDLAVGIPITAGLPSDRRRDELEALVWKATQDTATHPKGGVCGFCMNAGYPVGNLQDGLIRTRMISEETTSMVNA